MMKRIIDFFFSHHIQVVRNESLGDLGNTPQGAETWDT